MPRPSMRLAGAGVLLAAALVACSETSTSPGGNSRDLISQSTVGAPDSGEFEICKHGTAATFDYSVDGGATQQVSLADGGCAVLAATLVIGSGNHSVTVTEVADPAIVLDSIVATINTIRDPVGVRNPPVTGTPTYTNSFNGDRGVLVEFYNSPVPPPPGGCTATVGFWKNHTSEWPTGFDPSATFYTSGQTWLQVLNTSPKGNAYYILAHQFIAATLNSANGASVPSNVATALATAAGYFANPGGSSLTRTDLINLATLLDSYNNGGQGVPHCGGPI